MDVDKLQLKLASRLKFQVLAYVCLGIIYARGAWNVFGVIFLAAESGHSCDSNRQIRTGVAYNNGNSYINSSVNMSFIQQSSVLYSRECDVIVALNSSTNVTVPCTYAWVYSSEFVSTIVSEWDLVCVRAYLSELSTTLYLIGSMCGALLISPLSDRFGRRLVLLVCLLSQAVMGACVAASPNYAVFTTLRFIVGFFNMGIALSTYVMMTEIFPASQRTIPCCGFQIFWAFGIMLTALFGFLVRDWRHLQLVFSLPNIPCAVLVWFLPESLPWLISQDKLTQAQSVVKRISSYNKIDVPNDICLYEAIHHERELEPVASTQYSEQPMLSGIITQEEADTLLAGELSSLESLKSNSENNETAEETYCSVVHKTSTECAALSEEVETKVISPVSPLVGDEEKQKNSENRNSVLLLCQSPRFRLYSFIIFYLFFGNSLSYFGISLSTPVLHGNPFFNLFLLGAVEIPAYIICVFICERIGRKVPLCVFLLTCGLMNITAMLISEKASDGLNDLRIAFVMIGKFAITGAYTTVYLYSAEIFPTSLRNLAMGVSSFFENFGSIAAPFIVFSAKSIPELPMILFGSVSIIGGIMVTAMPETHRRPLPQGVEEVESWDVCGRRK
ncbi:organic cation transporter protein-like [Physella acuta]|uniref:organic cation transporter protein-like n=1 Tax=Physella acuta TaxID=109671 RepID=UPI0027DB6FDB|nr:organic cation transporter protein-like [Physella acuta]